MTPKEKADELCLKYYKIIERTLSIEHVKITKQCALIAVDNIILANPHSNPFNTDVYSTMDYWIEVKKELEEMK